MKAGGVCDLPKRVIDSFSEKQTYIAEGEALAVFMAVAAVDWLRNGFVVFHVDNLGVVSGMCTGTSSSVDFGGTLVAIHLACAHRCLAPWTEHVDMYANPADGWSREGISDPLASELGYAMKLVEFPEKWPCSVSLASCEQWRHLLDAF